MTENIAKFTARHKGDDNEGNWWDEDARVESNNPAEAEQEVRAIIDRFNATLKIGERERELVKFISVEENIIPDHDHINEEEE